MTGVFSLIGSCNLRVDLVHSRICRGAVVYAAYAVLAVLIATRSTVPHGTYVLPTFW